MRRLRVTAAMRNHLERLRGVRGHVRGGVMAVPRRQTVDEWDAAASKQQDELLENARDQCPVAVVPAPAPTPVPPPDSRPKPVSAPPVSENTDYEHDAAIATIAELIERLRQLI